MGRPFSYQQLPHVPHSPSPSSWHLPEPLLFMLGPKDLELEQQAGFYIALLLPVLLLVLLPVLLSPLVMSCC